MNLVLMTEGTGQGVRGRKTNVSRVYDLLAEGKSQRINLEAGPGTRAFRRLGGTFFGADAMSIVNHHQNWFLNHAPRTGELKIFLFGFSRGALIMRVFAEWLGQRRKQAETFYYTAEIPVGTLHDGFNVVEFFNNADYTIEPKHCVWLEVSVD